MVAVTTVAADRAREILEQACTPLGLMASPEGYPHQAWSAGMYLFAERCVQDGWLPVFDVAEGW